MKKKKQEWFANESFWKVTFPYMFHDDRFKKAADEVDKILDLTKFKGKTVLDLCCGPGRHSIQYAKKGYNVTGVDKSSFLLSKAKKLANDNKVNIKWINKDMKLFKKKDSFDLAQNLFTSFGYFDSEKDNIKVLENIYESLKKNGTLILDTISKEWLCRNYSGTHSDDMADGAVLIQRHKFINDYQQMKKEWILIQNGKTKSYKFQHYVYTAKELMQILTFAGFKNIKAYSSLDGDIYGPDTKSNRLIITARK